MRVLLVGRNAHIGGGSTFRLNIGRGLQERGHQVTIAAFGGAMTKRYHEAGLAFRWSPPYRPFAGRLASVARQAAVDVVHASNTTVGDVAWEAARRLDLPLVLSLHNTIADHEARHECLKRAGRVIVFDEGARASAANFPAEFDPAKLVVIPRPVEHVPLDASAVSPLEAAYVGRLSSRKGRVALDVIRGFEQFSATHPGGRLLILGDGSMEREVRAEAARASAAGRCRVSVLGRTLEPHRLLQSCGVVLGAGYAALESLMRGKAVIGAGFNGFGPITASNVEDAVQANFGDTVHRWDLTPDHFAGALAHLAEAWQTDDRPRYWGLDRILAARHSIASVAERIEGVYRDASAEKAAHA